MVRSFFARYPKLPGFLFLVACICLAVTIGIWHTQRVHEENMLWWRDVSFNGCVVDRSIDRSNHNFTTVVLDVNGMKAEYHYPQMYNALEVGDSLIKQSGHLNAMIKSPEGGVHEFNLFIRGRD